MKRSKFNSLFLVAIASILVLSSTGCSGGSAVPPPPPPPPAITVSLSPSNAQSVDQGQSMKFTATVNNDSSNKGVTWALMQNGSSCSPACGAITPTTTPSGQPATYTAPAAVNANIQFNVTATSVADSTKSQTDATTAVPPPAPNNPASLPAATVGQAYSYQLTETGGVAPFTWSIKSGSLPHGLSLSSTTGVISGTVPATAKVSASSPALLGEPAAASSATAPVPVNFQFTVAVVDSGTPPLQATQPLAIAAALSPLTITTASLPNGVAGAAYSQSLAASGGLPPYTWKLVGGALPGGLTLSPGGVISGTPATAGPSNFTVQVADSAPSNQTATQSLSITVTGLAITSSNFFGGIIGNAFNATLTASGGTPPYTWSAGSLPAGLNPINASTGAITGTPKGPAGTTNVTVQVQDSGNPKQTANQFVDFTIGGTPLSISTTSLPNGTVGTPYSANLLPNGGISPIKWSISAGTLPTGLSFTASTGVGVISGTPTTAGTTNFTVQVQDDSSPPEIVSQPLSITINPANTPKFAFARPSLPDGKIGTPYDQSVWTVNGTGAVTITKVSGTFPPGLSLTTVNSATYVQGTPQAPISNPYVFTLQATDSSTPAQTAQITYTISITNVGSCVFDVSGAGPPNGNTSLQGIYVYRIQGFDSSGNPVARLGIFSADGNQARDASQSFGHITGVVEDSVTAAGFTPTSVLASSTYCIDPSTNITDIILGSVHYRAAIIGNLLGTSDGISFIEFDATDNVRGSGVMRLQEATAITQPASGTVNYVFGMSGRDNSKATNVPVAVVGTFSLDPTLASAPGLSGSTGEEDFFDTAANGLVVPTVNYPGITVKLNTPPSASGRYTGSLTSSPASGDINFAAYVIKAASGLPSTNSPTLLFAISTGTPANTVLSGEIVSQNFASQTTFANSQIAGTPDARALPSFSSAFYVSGLDPAAVAGTNETSAAAIGFIGFNGNGGLPGPSGKITNIELDSDVGGTVTGPVTATNPPGATYTVAADGRTIFNGAAVPGVAYLADLDTGFVLDSGGIIARAGFGQLLFSRNPGAGFPPVSGIFALVSDVAIPVLDSATTTGSVSPVTGGLNWTLSVDSPFSGLTASSSSPSPLSFTNTDAFGRFTVGTCPPPPGVFDVCLVGYTSSTFELSGGGVLVIDETNTGPKLMPQWPSITIWGVVP